jgi:hypothetical protein
LAGSIEILPSENVTVTPSESNFGDKVNQQEVNVEAVQDRANLRGKIEVNKNDIDSLKAIVEAAPESAEVFFDKTTPSPIGNTNENVIQLSTGIFTETPVGQTIFEFDNINQTVKNNRVGTTTVGMIFKTTHTNSQDTNLTLRVRKMLGATPDPLTDVIVDEYTETLIGSNNAEQQIENAVVFDNINVGDIYYFTFQAAATNITAGTSKINMRAPEGGGTGDTIPATNVTKDDTLSDGITAQSGFDILGKVTEMLGTGATLKEKFNELWNKVIPLESEQKLLTGLKIDSVATPPQFPPAYTRIELRDTLGSSVRSVSSAESVVLGLPELLDGTLTIKIGEDPTVGGMDVEFVSENIGNVIEPAKIYRLMNTSTFSNIAIAPTDWTRITDPDDIVIDMTSSPLGKGGTIPNFNGSDLYNIDGYRRVHVDTNFVDVEGLLSKNGLISIAAPFDSPGVNDAEITQIAIEATGLIRQCKVLVHQGTGHTGYEKTITKLTITAR